MIDCEEDINTNMAFVIELIFKTDTYMILLTYSTKYSIYISSITYSTFENSSIRFTVSTVY